MRFFRIISKDNNCCRLISSKVMRCVDKSVLGLKLICKTVVGNMSVSDVFVGLHSGWKQKRRDFVCHVYNLSENCRFWVISVTFCNTTFHNQPVVYVRTDRHANGNGRIFFNFLFQRAKIFERGRDIPGKGNENSGNNAQDSPQHTRCLLFLRTKHCAAATQLLCTYPGFQNTKDFDWPK